jgi:hypothetical protein
MPGEFGLWSTVYGRFRAWRDAGVCTAAPLISTITDKVMDGMAEWQNRPFDRVHPVLFVNAVNVKIRDGQVANRPLYVVMAVAVAAPATSSASGPVTAARARSTGRTCSPSWRTAAWTTC